MSSASVRPLLSRDRSPERPRGSGASGSQKNDDKQAELIRELEAESEAEAEEAFHLAEYEGQA